MPWGCVHNTDCDDSLPCTTDICTSAKQCTNALQTGFCLINKKCYKANDTHPSSDCAICDPSSSTSIWTIKKDGTACKSDGLSCTHDSCQNGMCEHDLLAGCLINNKCVSENATDPSNTCGVCIHKLSSTKYSFIAGRPCSPGGGQAGMCYNTKCRAFVQKTYDPPGSFQTSLRAVDYIPSAKRVWAAGEYRAAGTPGSSTKGVLVDVASVGSTSGTVQVQTSQAFLDINHLAAVGAGSTAYIYQGGKWVASLSLQTYANKAPIRGVWGARINNLETLYLTGDRGSALGGISRCVMGSTGAFSCAKHTGFSSSASIGVIYGSLQGTAQGPLWAGTNGSYFAPEDIYYNPGSGSTWTRSGPHGCQDSGSNPCANTSSESHSLNGSGTKDVWLVGNGGMIIHYDGSKWNRINAAFDYQTYHTIHGVYASTAAGLATVATVINWGGSTGHQVRLYNYNTAMKLWLGPITLLSSYNNSPDFIYDIDGQSYADLWLVGQRRTSSGPSARTRGWIVNLK